MSLASTEWRQLTFLQRYEIPSLFYRFHPRQDAFTLHITDLVDIWDGSLNQNAIYVEASIQQSSIDPSDSSSQLKVLILKMEEALANGKNALAMGQVNRNRSFRLHTQIALPPPLKALSWTFNLSQQDSGSLSRHLLLPALRECLIQTRKLQALEGIIKEKDHVISRLLDKVESSGMDLSIIFPGISGLRSRKRNVSIAEASNHVPGMGAFQRDTWTKQFYKKGEDCSAGLAGLLNGSTVDDVEKQFQKHFHSRWTSCLPQLEETNLRRVDVEKQSIEGLDGKDTSRSRSASSDEHSGQYFQRQQTPPSLQRHSERKKFDKKSLGWASTSSGSTSPNSSVRPTQVSKVGFISSRNPAKSPSKATTRPPLSSSSSPINAEKQTATSIVTTSSSSSGSSPVPKPNQASSVGTLGGRHRTPRESNPNTETLSSPSTPSRKIGVLGGRQGTTTPEISSRASLAQPAEREARAHRATATGIAASSYAHNAAAQTRTSEVEKNATSSPSPDPKAPQSRATKAKKELENAAEKANRKRDELKKELKGGRTAVKRRKF